MDRNTLIGLVLIVLVVVGFSIFAPSEPAAEQTSDTDSTEQITADIDSNELANVTDYGAFEPKLDEKGVQIKDEEKGWLYVDTTTLRDTFLPAPYEVEITQPVLDSNIAVVDTTPSKPQKEEKTYTLENEKLKLEFTSKGGHIKNVWIKDFKTYDDYMAGNNEPLQLYDSLSTFGLIYKQGDANIRTDELDFKLIELTETSITLESKRKGKSVGFTYSLKKDKYDLDYNVYFKGFSDKEVKKTRFVADFYLLATEKYFENEERLATLYWQNLGDDYDYIQTTEQEDLEAKVEWLAFRSTFFTAIISNKSGFSPNESEVTLKRMADENQTKYIKKFGADLNLGATAATNTVELNWYFGPVDYDVLVAYENGTEDIVELGTGLFRWINKYMIRPLFMMLINSGMSLALAILLLTIIVKLILSPVNYKMYKSSAMMKVLKPQIEKISKKYPKKEDAMKKQQETMALYRETGVSPLAGCIPMLIQMPILFAIFRLFPSAIELRQQPFLWAEDLSTYDSPITFGFNIPFYGDHVSILTLLMAITTLLYTHYNSSNMQQPTQEGMPNMKFIMYFFPIMMIFFFNSYASGLSYYYFISTLMTIGIMFAIKRFFIDEEKILAKIEANQANPNRKKGKSKFQQRLEEAQRLQQDRQKNKRK